MRFIRPFLLLLLGGCIPHPTARSGEQGRRIAEPGSDDPGNYRRCLADLTRYGAKIEALPDRVFPNGCSATASVKLVAIGIPVTNLGAMRCGLALPFVQWVQQAVSSAALDRLGSPVVRIESFGSFACRPVNNVPGNRLSEHGRANAVDIAAFVLADGRRVSVFSGWSGPDGPTRDFLRQVRDAACRRFDTVLSPDYNAYHHDHLHFDMGNGRTCR